MNNKSFGHPGLWEQRVYNLMDGPHPWPVRVATHLVVYAVALTALFALGVGAGLLGLLLRLAFHGPG